MARLDFLRTDGPLVSASPASAHSVWGVGGRQVSAVTRICGWLPVCASPTSAPCTWVLPFSRKMPFLVLFSRFAQFPSFLLFLSVCRPSDSIPSPLPRTLLLSLPQGGSARGHLDTVVPPQPSSPLSSLSAPQ